jgi:hypothetical protein
MNLFYFFGGVALMVGLYALIMWRNGQTPPKHQREVPPHDWKP